MAQDLLVKGILVHLKSILRIIQALGNPKLP